MIVGSLTGGDCCGTGILLCRSQPMVCLYNRFIVCTARVVAAAAGARFLVLDVVLVGAGHGLDDLAVPVIAGDGDAGVRKFLLDADSGNEDDTARGDEFGTDFRHILDRGGTDAESHVAQSGNRHAVPFSSPSDDNRPEGAPSGLQDADGDTGILGCLFQYFRY